jgi:hypothetical protein
MKMARSLLGKKVKDKVSGFEGIVVGRHTFLAGCDRYSVQPPVDKDGKLPEQQTFDDPQLKIVKEKKVVIKGEKPGGPMPVIPKKKHTPSR